MTLLRVSGLDVHYGDFQAIYGLDVEVNQAETLAIIGANGAGKSTLLRAIAGQVPPSAGTIEFSGHDITRTPAHRRVPLGIALTPEGRRIFPSLTVEENLRVGAHVKRTGPWTLDAVYAAFPLVAERKDRLGVHLSGGEQQATAIGRALMSNPALLLLDEVSLGLAPVVVEQIYATLPTITAAGTTVLIVEQDVNQSMRVADRVQCLLEGRSVLHGRPADLSREHVAAAYFGI